MKSRLLEESNWYPIVYTSVAQMSFSIIYFKFLLVVLSLNFLTEVIISNFGLALAISEIKNLPLLLRPKTLT